MITSKLDGGASACVCKLDTFGFRREQIAFIYANLVSFTSKPVSLRKLKAQSIAWTQVA